MRSSSWACSEPPLIYGDGIITPAISVLSALEGVNVATEVLEPYVMPAAVAILLCLFAVQGRGTARIGKVFGPLMLLWFGVIAALGIAGIVHHPQVLAALDPRHAIAFLVHNGWAASPFSAAFFWRSPGARRSTPIWGISAEIRS